MKWKERLLGMQSNGLKNMKDDKELEEFIAWCNERITNLIQRGDDDAAAAVERGRDTSGS